MRRRVFFFRYVDLCRLNSRGSDSAFTPKLVATLYWLPGISFRSCYSSSNTRSLRLKQRRTFFAESHCSLVGIIRSKTAHDRLDLVLKGTLQFGL